MTSPQSTAGEPLFRIPSSFVAGHTRSIRFPTLHLLVKRTFEPRTMTMFSSNSRLLANEIKSPRTSSKERQRGIKALTGWCLFSSVMLKSGKTPVWYCKVPSIYDVLVFTAGTGGRNFENSLAGHGYCGAKTNTPKKS